MSNQIQISLNVNLNEANVILESLGNNRLNDIFPLYTNVRFQVESQVMAYNEQQRKLAEHNNNPDSKKTTKGGK